ncbi:MAG: YbaN family protein [Bdellovibrionaceae bacterium]|nr:YbaN family protein [Pseudobdellovibrionaceae bacterium]
MAVVRNRLARLCLFAFGALFVALGIAGAFLPILPTTPFILLAAWCFLRSSEKAHNWLYNHSIFGEPLKNWEKNHAISKPAKTVSLTMISASGFYIYLTIDDLWQKYILLAVLAGVSVFIITTRDR